MTQPPLMVRFPWKPIEPLRPEDALSNGRLAALEALRREWDRHLSALSDEDRKKVRHQSLRRLSVETGILERLYEIDWGVTLTLVAEGFAREVVERAGGRVDDRTLMTLKAQLGSLEMVLDFVSNDRALTPSFIKELHQAITRTQATYLATDSLGRTFDKTLRRGEWKLEPNHVILKDNSILEYCPPEHVASEVDHLTQLYEDGGMSAVHPITQAAWLHHRFVQIHPFEDGNGRVARALTLLVFEKHRYAPLVVDRWHRESYIDALDAANLGDLQPLVRLFVKLESSALTSELERPAAPPPKGLSTEVAHTLATQLAMARDRRQSDVVKRLVPRATAVSGMMERWFSLKATELRVVFSAKNLKDVHIFADTQMPPHSSINWWFRDQVIKSARTAGHFAEFQHFSGWSHLRLRFHDTQLFFVASLHGAGREPGVMAVTTFGILSSSKEAESGDPSLRNSENLATTNDAFRFVQTERIEEIQARAEELEGLLDEGLTEALAQTMGQV